MRRLLRDELGTTPGPALLALHRELLAAGEERAPAPPPRPSPPSRGRADDDGGIAAPPHDLVEREDELRAMDGSLSAPSDGAGAVILFEGPAGIGKTRLLEDFRPAPPPAAIRVLTARAGLLERDFAFGVVRQLLEGAVDRGERRRSGRGGPRPGDGERCGRGNVPDPRRPVPAALSGLTDAAPLVLCVDDLQWSDPGSLRFIAYLARRLRPLPVLLAATIRTGEPDADEALLAELAQEPVTVSLTPRPLSLQATADLVAERLGGRPSRVHRSPATRSPSAIRCCWVGCCRRWPPSA